MEEMNKQTIGDALGLSPEWEKKNQENIVELLGEEKTVTEVMERLIKRIKNEEFGEEEYTISEYEKKLFFAGMEMSREMVKLAAYSQMFKGMLDMMGDITKNDEKD